MIETKTHSAIQIIAVLTARAGQEENLRNALCGLVPLVRQEPGCIEYTLHEDMKNPGVFVFYETWSDQAAIDFHGQTPHFQAFAATFDTLLAAPLRINLMKKIE